LTEDVPRVPASVGALIWDEQERLLILKPTYKKGWTIPGGQIDADGESPWDACRREVREECGLAVGGGRLVCVDFRPPGTSRPGGIRFVFDCGSVDEREREAIRLDGLEIAEYRFAELADALELLSNPLRRRVSECAHVKQCVYLEDGRPVPTIRR
jgi:8-oxo-dGTP diphosphatase